MNSIEIEILKLLRSCSSASLFLLNDEVGGSINELCLVATDLQEQGFVDLIGISKESDQTNPLLHINGVGLAYLDAVEGNVDTVI